MMRDFRKKREQQEKMVALAESAFLEEWRAPTLDSFVNKKEWGEEGSGNVVFLNDYYFERYRKETPMFLAMFYTHWCGHCKRFKPKYAKASLGSGETPLVALDCESTGKVTCKLLNVKSFPTVQWFNNKYEDGTPDEYHGSGDEAGILAFIAKATHDGYVRPPKAALSGSAPEEEVRTCNMKKCPVPKPYTPSIPSPPTPPLPPSTPSTPFTPSTPSTPSTPNPPQPQTPGTPTPPSTPPSPPSPPPPPPPPPPIPPSTSSATGTATASSDNTASGTASSSSTATSSATSDGTGGGGTGDATSTGTISGTKDGTRGGTGESTSFGTTSHGTGESTNDGTSSIDGRGTTGIITGTGESTNDGTTSDGTGTGRITGIASGTGTGGGSGTGGIIPIPIPILIPIPIPNQCNDHNALEPCCSDSKCLWKKYTDCATMTKDECSSNTDRCSWYDTESILCADLKEQSACCANSICSYYGNQICWPTAGTNFFNTCSNDAHYSVCFSFQTCCTDLFSWLLLPATLFCLDSLLTTL